ncbi:hypothetical protein GH714_036133 [Hevea brasiliensis]|uniref:Uncharacterized protein n=1 Tax=Hevea brasiliensis TaxID=3981 RepID=A0A6A6KNA4_HEVBR|nr:hypothetical protein GH714_036133 [Hevea brasiliensis]
MTSTGKQSLRLNNEVQNRHAFEDHKPCVSGSVEVSINILCGNCRCYRMVQCIDALESKVRRERQRTRETKFLHLEAFEGFLVRPGLDGQIGLGIQPNTKDHNGQEAGDVARELPVLPLRDCPGGGGVRLNRLRLPVKDPHVLHRLLLLPRMALLGLAVEIGSIASSDSQVIS